MQHFQKRLLPCLCHYLRCPLIYKSGCSHVCRTVITGSRTGREHVPEIFDDTVIIFVYIVRCQREPRQGIMLYLTISHDYHIIATKIFIYLHSVQDFNPVCRIFGIPGPPGISVSLEGLRFHLTTDLRFPFHRISKCYREPGPSPCATTRLQNFDILPVHQQFLHEIIYHYTTVPFKLTQTE